MNSSLSGSDRVPSPSASVAWSRFIAMFAVVALGTSLVLWAFAIVMDPYGLRAGPQHPPTTIMDINQRYMYPQLARGGQFESAVFGTSTIRLLNPEQLNALFHERFVNFGMNASTPWEQKQIFELFLRHMPNPKTLVLGLDLSWCSETADRPDQRLTFRSFPAWMYQPEEANRLSNYAHLFNFRTVEIAARVALNGAGVMPERIRGDGYEVFVPPDRRYNLEKARAYIWGGGPARLTPVEPPVVLSDKDEDRLAFPAVGWLDGMLDRLPPGAKVILAFPPVHVAVQPRPGSEAAAQERVCKRRITEVARRHRALVVDFRYPSPVTTDDANYWDPLHHRLGIAQRFTQALHSACAGTRQDADAFFKVLSDSGTPCL